MNLKIIKKTTKKILLSAVCLVVVAAADFGSYTYYENQQMDPWLKANIAALASIETPNKGEGGAGHTGGIANKRCPIWNVTVITVIGLSPSITITCSTGGAYQCESGKCPHS